MVNEEEKQLEDIIAPKQAPARATKKGTPKNAKLTGRTISSLRERIKEKNLEKAYKRYNRKYQQMKNALREAEDLRKAREEGAHVTKAEVDLAYDYVVDKYSKKLAKMGAKLLKTDIKKLPLIDSPKRIKIPRILNTVLHKISMNLAKGTSISEGIAKVKQNKEVKQATKAYIEGSLRDAIFEKPNVKPKDRELKDEVDAKVIRDLGLKGDKEQVEQRLDTLRGFISQDGSKPLFKDKDNKPSGIDVPPAEPTPSVEKEEPKVDAAKFYEALNKGKDNTEKKDDKKNDEPTVDLSKIMNPKKEEAVVEPPVKGKEDEPKVETAEKKVPSNRKDEVAEIIRCTNNIEKLKKAVDRSTDSDAKAALQEKLDEEKAKLARIQQSGLEPKEKEAPVEKTETSKESNLEDSKKQSLEPIVVEEPKAKEEPIVKAESSDEQSKKEATIMDNVNVTNVPVVRAEQVSNPEALRVTPKEITDFLAAKKAHAEAKALNVSLTQTLVEKRKELAALVNEFNTTKENIGQELQRYNADNAAKESELAGVVLDIENIKKAIK